MVRKYVISGQSTNWLHLVQLNISQNYESQLLRDFSLDYAKVLSYEKVSSLTQLRIGNDKLSDQHIYNLTQRYAKTVKSEQELSIINYNSSDYSIETSRVDIYSSDAKEIIFLSDGVCVNEQKPKRDKIAKTGKERTTTNILMLQTDIEDRNAYKTIIAADGVNEADLIRAEIYKTYSTKIKQLPIVCISDGATSIKNQNKSIFGNDVTHILDWYHLQSKVTQLMSQIAIHKSSKEEAINIINNYLWNGNVINAVLVLKFMQVKNQTKRDELIKYLEKNQDHIINYECRKQAGKIIGSGRTEKQNDCIVSKRQKRKGMSWSKNGSRNLAILTAYHSKAT